jgi:hypothetical protein
MRIRYPGLLIGLLAFVVIAAIGYLGLLIDLAHARSGHGAAYRAGERALHSVALPSGVVDTVAAASADDNFACRSGPDTRCLHTSALPNDIRPVLSQVIDVTHDDCGEWTGAMLCAEVGRIAGQTVVAIVYPHVSIAPTGRVPDGAVRAPGRGAYYRGSDIVLQLTTS